MNIISYLNEKQTITLPRRTIWIAAMSTIFMAIKGFLIVFGFPS